MPLLIASKNNFFSLCYVVSLSLCDDVFHLAMQYDDEGDEFDEEESEKILGPSEDSQSQETKPRNEE